MYMYIHIYIYTHVYFMSFPRSVLAAAGRLTPARRDRDRPGLGSRRLVCIYDYIYIYI